MTKRATKISERWIEQNREFFRNFLDETDFPDPDRAGERGPTFVYPEWLIMFISVLSVKLNIKNYVQINKIATECCDPIAKDLDLKPLSERQLRDCLKKSAITLESQQCSFFRCFLNWSHDPVISADKMMNRAKGPIWRKKQKDQGIVPKRLRGPDKQATWSKSHTDDLAYGLGSFSLTSHQHPVLGCFILMPNSGNEAKRMWSETAKLKGCVD